MSVYSPFGSGSAFGAFSTLGGFTTGSALAYVGSGYSQGTSGLLSPGFAYAATSAGTGFTSISSQQTLTASSSAVYGFTFTASGFGGAMYGGVVPN